MFFVTGLIRTEGISGETVITYTCKTREISFWKIHIFIGNTFKYIWCTNSVQKAEEGTMAGGAAR